MGRSPGTPQLVTFHSLAFLLTPAEPGRRVCILETDLRWRFDPRAVAGVDTVLWGRAPLPSGSPLLRSARAAVDRELMIQRVRRWTPGHLICVGVHRLPPPAFLPQRAWNSLRGLVLGGAMVELSVDPEIPRILDKVARSAGAAQRIGRFRAGSGGSVLARLPSKEGGRLILRASESGAPADPTRATEALVFLAQREIPLVPRLTGKGLAAGASWSAETELAGHRPGRVGAAVAADVVRFCLRLPRTSGPPTAQIEDLDLLGTAFPQWRDVISEISFSLAPALASLPGVMRHGDLWSGNLLVKGEHLTGVIDWDAWHPSGVPGTDLLHLLATEERYLRSWSLGEFWLQRPWRSHAIASTLGRYWQGLGLRPETRILDAVGLAWWAAQVASTLCRLPGLAEDQDWVTENVTQILKSVTP